MQKQKVQKVTNQISMRHCTTVSTVCPRCMCMHLSSPCCECAVIYEWTASAGSIGIVFSSSHLYDKYSLCIL